MNRSRVTGDLASHGNIFVDIANDRVGIGSTIPGEKLSLPDSAKIALGNSDDLQIYHDGSHSYIHDGGTGNLKLRSNNFRVSNADESKLSATFQASGAAELYHDNVKRFETHGYGNKISASNAEPHHTNAFSRAALNISGQFGGGLALDDLGNGGVTHYLSGSGAVYNISMATAGGTPEKAIEINRNGNVELYYDNAKKLETKTWGIDVTGTTGTDGLSVSGVTTFSASDTPGLQFTNATFGTKLYIGGYTGTTNSSNISRIRTSTGNLHIDSASNGGIYLNN